MHPADTLRALDLNLLLALDALLEARGVSQAARRLGLSQPATSHALARLREALGDPLLVRDGAGMAPTPRALALQGPLRAALVDLGRLLAEAGGFDPAVSRRRFTLACPDILAPLVPELLAALAEAPGVDLELGPEGAEADLTLGSLLVADPRLRGRVLGRARWAVAMRPGHPALERPWSVEAWLAWPHVVVRTPAPGPGLVEQSLTEAGHSRRVGLYAPSFLLAAAVVARTDLLFTAPEAVLRRLEPPLAVRPPPLSLPDVPVAATWPERLDGDPGHRWFRERVVGVVGAALAPTKG